MKFFLDHDVPSCGFFEESSYEARTLTAAVKANETTEVDVTLAPR